MDPSARNNAVRRSSGATICIENTIKTHVFQSSSTNRKRIHLPVARSGPTRWAPALDQKHSTDQWGNSSLRRIIAPARTTRLSETSENLRKFGGQRLGVSPSFLMRDSNVVGLTSKSAAAPFEPRIRQ